MIKETEAGRGAVGAPVEPSVRLPDADAAFKDWVRAIPLHERTPWNVWHAAVDWVRCEFGKEVARRLKAERDAHRLAVEEHTLRLRYGVVSGWIVRALKALDTLDPDDSTEADELRKLIAAGEVLALTTLANSKTPNVEVTGKPPRGAAGAR